MLAGPLDGPGEESFNVMIATPTWLHHEVAEHGPLIGRHHLIVESWHWPRIREFLRRAVESTEGRDWSELAAKIGRIGHWESEDYEP